MNVTSPRLLALVFITGLSAASTAQAQSFVNAQKGGQLSAYTSPYNTGATANPYGLVPPQGQLPASYGVLNQYADKYKQGGGHGYKSGKANVFSSKNYALQFIRPLQNSDDFVTLRLSQKSRINGCLAGVDGTITQQRRAKTLTIELPEIAPKLTAQSPSHYGCNQRGHVVKYDITLDRQEITAGNLQRIILRDEKSKIAFNLRATDNTVQLLDKDDTLLAEHFIYPENIVVLESENTPDHLTTLQKLAHKHGLVSAAQVMNNPDIAPNYFIDPGKKLANILATGDMRFFDKMHIQETFLGSEGAYNMSRTIDVFARKPGLYE